MTIRLAPQLLILSCVAGTPALATAAAADNSAVMAAVQSMLDAWREADAAKLEAALHKDFREVTLHLQDGKWNSTVVDRATLVGLMGKIGKGSWDDRLLKPQVHEDGPIAVVWSPYKFTVRYVENGVKHEASHCGIETFQLYRTDTGWQIINFADTHSDACPA
jgi:hypothetical protein